MAVVKTQFTDLYYQDPDTDEIIEVGCVTSITGLTAARDQIETTCLNSVGRTYEAGLPTPGTASFTVNFAPDDDSHTRLHELYRLGTKVDWLLGWGDYAPPRGPGLGPEPTAASAGMTAPNTRTWLSFNGYVSDFPFDFALNTVVTSNIAVQVSDFPVLLPKA